MSLAQRSVTSIGWNVATYATRSVVLFVRSVLLARLLPVEVFGTYAGAGAVVGLSAVVASFGFSSAFIHRTTETEDEGLAAAVLFTLVCTFTAAWAVLLGAGAFVFAGGQTRTALLALTAATGVAYLAGVAKTILVRRVVHRRLALIQFLDAVLTTLVAVGLAWRGVTLWALLSTDLVSALLSIVLLYLWKPVWRPRLVWAPAVMLYFIRFGSRQFVVNTLSVALDRLDDLWTRVFLGSTPLGLYSRAYALATYPRQILAVPINAVTVGTFAELKEDRFSLSRAFFRANAALVYTGFLMSGLLILTAPEIIRLLLGVKWLPMLITFRLMLIFTLLDPLRGTSVNLFVAVGKPEQIGKVQLVQLASLLIGLFFLAPRFGINGVAVAVDAMLVIGIVLMLWHARAYVDFSLTRLFAGPGLALIGGLALGRGVIALPGVAGSDWRTGILKAVVFGAVYAAVLVATGRRQLYESLAPFVGRALNAIRKQPAAGP